MNADILTIRVNMMQRYLRKLFAKLQTYNIYSVNYEVHADFYTLLSERVRKRIAHYKEEIRLAQEQLQTIT